MANVVAGLSITLCLTLSLHATSSQAGSANALRDPMRPAAPLAPTSRGSAPEANAEPPRPSFQLQATQHLASGQRQALINGQWRQLGEAFDDHCLQSISADEVMLTQMNRGNSGRDCRHAVKASHTPLRLRLHELQAPTPLASRVQARPQARP